MPLPEEFNDVEHLQSVCRLVVNRMVREDFSDLGGEEWDRSIASARGSLRVACTHEDQDSLNMTVARLLTYYLVQGKAARLQTPVYGIPTTTYQELSLKYKPQITLYFDQSRREATDDYPRATGEISWRLMHETSESITEAELRLRANKIKNLFVTPNLFIWHKGKVICKYTDLENGYKLRLLVTNEAEGRRIIEQVLDVENKSPDWENLTVSESRASYPSTPPSKHIYGKSRKLPRRRPVENVKFRHATADIWGVSKPVALIDTRFSLGNPLIQVA